MKRVCRQQSSLTTGWPEEPPDEAYNEAVLALQALIEGKQGYARPCVGEPKSHMRVPGFEVLSETLRPECFAPLQSAHDMLDYVRIARTLRSPLEGTVPHLPPHIDD